MNVLKWLKSKNCEIAPRSFAKAVSNDNFPIVEFLKEINCEVNEEVSFTAILKNNLDVLKWLKSKNCEIAPRSFSLAVKNDNLEIVTYLEEIKCYIPGNILDDAFFSGNKKIIQHFLDLGYTSITKETIKNASFSGKVENVDWILDLCVKFDIELTIKDIPNPEGIFHKMRCFLENLIRDLSWKNSSTVNASGSMKFVNNPDTIGNYLPSDNQAISSPNFGNIFETDYNVFMHL